jgi:serine/threonine-protein kinase ULK/ATG1
LLENLESEIAILKRITHRNIVELKDCLVRFSSSFPTPNAVDFPLRKRDADPLDDSTLTLFPSNSQKTDTHIYLIMDFCSAGDLSVYIRKRGDLPSLTASNQGLLPDTRRKELDPTRVLYPHPKEGGLNETIVRCFLGQLGASSSSLVSHTTRN